MPAIRSYVQRLLFPRQAAVRVRASLSLRARSTPGRLRNALQALPGAKHSGSA